MPVVLQILRSLYRWEYSVRCLTLRLPVRPGLHSAALVAVDLDFPLDSLGLVGRCFSLVAPIHLPNFVATHYFHFRLNLVQHFLDSLAREAARR